MNKPYLYRSLFLFVLVLAMVLRFAAIRRRPMHTDEAVHGMKFCALLDSGHYRYDKKEFHGPVLNYLTLLPAWLTGAGTCREIDEAVLRRVPAAMGVCMLLLLALLNGAMRRPAILASAALAAVSPVFVYYSRYYIQEILLAFFTLAFLAAAYRYIKSRKLIWALVGGGVAGLMHATKETFVISLGCMGLALVVLWLTGPRGITRSISRGKQSARDSGNKIFWHIPAAAGTAAVISAIFFSSFFTNMQGISDSYTFYETYLQRAGAGQAHHHPWHYYPGLLLWPGKLHAGVAGEWLIFLAGIWAMIQAWSGKSGSRFKDTGFIRFMSVYALLMLAVYSAIPYKTPWNLLQFWLGWIIPAGAGVMHFCGLFKKQWARTGVYIVLFAAGAHLLWQSYLLNFRYGADPRNPWAYAHTSRDIFKVTGRIRQLAGECPQGKDIYMEVIFPEHDYWPLPWYLRDFNNIGWWDHVAMDTPAAPLVLASPVFREDLLRKLYELPPPGQKHLYVPLFENTPELRPGMEIRGYVRKDFRDRSLLTDIF